MKMLLIRAFISLVAIFFASSLWSQSSFNRLVWSDEFNYEGLPDSSKWGYDKGRGCPQNCGWGNNELQTYTAQRAENARVQNGMLILEAHKENYEGAAYTSARLISRDKGDWKYGRIEVRAQLPAGRGMWPAIWMLPTRPAYGGWPRSGEIDIMEYVGYAPDSVFGTVHTEVYNGMIGTQRGRAVSSPDLSTAFHVYAVEWTPENISFLMDGQVYNKFQNERTGSAAWPFDIEFHLLLNIAVGGNWGGKHGVDDQIFPQRMLVDYVRVYQ